MGRPDAIYGGFETGRQTAEKSEGRDVSQRFMPRIDRDGDSPPKAMYIDDIMNGQRAALVRERIERERDFWHRQATKAAAEIAGDELSLGRVEKRGDRALVENSLRGLRRALTEASGRAGCDPGGLLTAARYEVRRKASDSIGPKQAQARGVLCP